MKPRAWMAASLTVCVCLLLLLAPGSSVAAPVFGIELSHNASEEQVVEVAAKAGQFKLTFNGATTGNIAVKASAATVQSELDALSTVGGVGGSVTVTNTVSVKAEIYFVTFGGGTFAETDVPQMTATNGTTPLSGGKTSPVVPAILVKTGELAGVSHSDEGADYAVKVSNTAPSTPPVIGETLRCIGTPPDKTWTGAPAPTFSYRWLRNGVAITGATSSSYTAVGADEGEALQCVVTGSNLVGVTTPSEIVTTRSSVVSQSAIVIGTKPSPEPPAPSSATVAASRPTVAGTGETAKRTCTAPTNWIGSPTFTYQWLRNGLPISGATTNEYTPGPEDKNKNLQCEVIGKTGTGEAPGGGTTLGISLNSFTGTLETTSPAQALPSNEASQTPLVASPNYTSGATVELELPGGLETYAFNFVNPANEEQAPAGWSCENVPAFGLVHAKAICTRSDALAPGSSYPEFQVITALGADAPNVAVATATVFGGGASPASATREFTLTAPIPFGFKTFSANILEELGNPYTQAGGHPFSAGVSFSANSYRPLFPPISKGFNGTRFPVGHVRDVYVESPRGFVGNALAVPELCPTAGLCESYPGSQVGLVRIGLSGATVITGIYAIKPEFGTPAQFAFSEPLGNVYTVTPRLRPADGYAITFESVGTPEIHLSEFSVALCDFGATATACKKAGEPGANPKPLFTNPTRCSGPPPTTVVRADTYEHPGVFAGLSFSSPPITGCEAVHFEPKAKVVPTSHRADSPTGMSVEITVPTEGVESTTGISQASLDTAKVTLPAGMSINPATADGLGACSEAQVGLGNNNEATCPESSKVGTIEIDTPLISEPLTGGVYVARQDENPFKATLGLYMVFSSKKNGIIIKIAGKLVTDPTTGQLTAVFTENPEEPFSKLVLHFSEGPRAPLVTPPKCGTYAIQSEFSPWSAANPAEPAPSEVVSEASSFEVNEGPNGGGCPSQSLEPKLKAGLQNPAAGTTTPFVLDLSREDGTQRFTALDLTLPKGLFAYLKGVPYCPDSVLASIPSAEGTGRAELANPSCPAASQVGTVQVGTGSGPDPFYATGKAYFAGPYKGAPFSIAIVTPAVAGPFDLGNVVVRSGLYVDPQTAQVTVKSDPIPTILDGILLDVRDIQVSINKPNFIVAPTDCEAMSVGAQVSGEQGATASASSRFQVGGCSSLAFKPVFNASTSAKTSRANGASLTVRLSQAHGEANIHRVKVELPKALPSRLTTLQKACTEQVFAQNPANCPAASAVGMAIARTPILPVPLVGPAYFVSHGSAKFPELILVLQGDGVTIDLDGETFISKTGITSSTFASVPDAPVESFELTLPTGKYSALAANGNLCTQKLVMPTEFTGQNGATTRQDTKIAVTGCPQVKKAVLTRAQKLKAALKACRKDKSKAKRSRCEKQARKQYGAVKKKSKSKAKKKGK